MRDTMTDYSKFTLTVTSADDGFEQEAVLFHVDNPEETVTLNLVGWGEASVRSALSSVATSAVWYMDNKDSLDSLEADKDNPLYGDTMKELLDITETYKDRYDFLSQHFTDAEIEGELAPSGLLEHRIFGIR